ncbi:MAG: beta-ketoacyl synthase N-terminal-like domain-containing protein [Burkholderiaceae bacterium]
MSAVRFLQTEDKPRPLAMPFVTCRSFDAAEALGKPLASMMERFSQLGVAAAFDAWADAGLSRQADEAAQRDDWDCLWGTALGGVLAFEKGYSDMWQKGRERLSPLSVVMGMNNAVNAHLSIQLGLGGASQSYTVACASSAVAIGEAFRRVRSGEATLAITGGSDATQTYGVARAWDAMRLISPGDETSAPAACRPFRRRSARTGVGGWRRGPGARRLGSRRPAGHASTQRWWATAQVATAATWCDLRPKARCAPSGPH